MEVVSLFPSIHVFCVDFRRILLLCFPTLKILKKYTKPRIACTKFRCNVTTPFKTESYVLTIHSFKSGLSQRPLGN